MRLVLCERRDLEEPEVTIAYQEMTANVKRVSDFVRTVDQTILCKKVMKIIPSWYATSIT